jgi:hypothetical protein
VRIAYSVKRGFAAVSARFWRTAAIENARLGHSARPIMASSFISAATSSDSVARVESAGTFCGASRVYLRERCKNEQASGPEHGADPASASFFARARKAHPSAWKAYFPAVFRFHVEASSCTLRYS